MKLRREISSTSEMWLFNDRKINKDVVVSTLQSAGLSKVNQYYIIKQGKVDDTRIQFFRFEVTIPKIF